MNKSALKDSLMSKAAKSVLVYGLYLSILGSFLLAVPNLLLNMFGFPETREVWIRVVGVLLLCLAFYCIQSAYAGIMAFFRWTIYTRGFSFLSFVVFVAFKLVQPTLILFGTIDLVGAIWTAVALRASASHLISVHDSEKL